MLRSGDPTNLDWQTINQHGAGQHFHKGEIISARDAVENRRARMLLGGGGMQFASPMEYDMTQAYAGQIWVHVGPNNNANTAGTIDPDSGLAVTSPVGWWCSCANGVPLANGINGNSNANVGYYIPQLPLPDSANIDDPKNYWVIFIGDPQCY